MSVSSRLHAVVHNWAAKKKAAPAAPRFRPALELLEDRCVPSTVSSIAANFTSTPIPAGDCLWFDSAFKVSGLGKATSVTLHATDQTVTFSAAGGGYTVSVPDSTITLSQSTTVATTSFDAGSNSWITNLPLSFAGNAFLGGAALPVTAALPGGVKTVTWTANFSTDTAGVAVNWQWGAAAYTSFASDYNALNVKPLDGGGAVTVYNNADHAGTPEAYKSFVVAGGTGGGGPNTTGNLTPAQKVTPSVDSTGPVLYPFASSNPLTSIAFSESDVLVASKMDATNGTFDVWYTDEHALALGVRQVNVTTASGTTTTNYPIATLTTDPGSAVNPAVGTTATTGDQAGTDPSGRPIAPSLFITDITNNPNSLAGDWQYGGAAIAPSAVFGAWKGFVRTVNDATSPATVTVLGDADPAKNGWNLGAGADAPPAGTTNDGYGAEVRWSLSDLYAKGVLIPGHTYRFYVIVHDGDQNKTGGDAGQAAYDVVYPGPATQPASLSGFVFNQNTGAGLSGVTLTLSYTNAQGQAVTLTALTAADGSYTFTNLPPGGYSVSASLAPGFTQISDKVGTDNGATDGSSLAGNIIGNINLGSGDAGVNYDFFELFTGS